MKSYFSIVFKRYMSILSRKHITWKPVGNSGSGTVSNSLKRISWTKERPKVDAPQQVQVVYESIPTKKQASPHKASMLLPTKRIQKSDDFAVHFANSVEEKTKEDLFQQEKQDNTIYQTFYRGENLLQLTEKEYLKLRGIVGKMFRSGEKDQRLLLPSAISEAFSKTWSVNVPVEQQKTASVAVIGLPNAGKSTLLNRLLGNKVVAVSRKRNTTRKTHSVYVTRDEKQLLIYDTPGMIGSDDAAKVHHERTFLIAAWNAAWNADVCFVIVDSSCKTAREATKRMLIELKQRMEEQGKEFLTHVLTQQEAMNIQKNILSIQGNNKQVWILGLNKVDHLANRQYLPDMAKEFYDIFPFAMSFMISAKKDKGIDHVRDFLFEMCKPGTWLSPTASPYGGSFVDMMEDILREKLLHCVHFEVPYHAKFQLESCQLISSGVVAVEEQILLERKSQVGMVLGPQGSNLKWIQRAAERDLSQAWKLPVILYLNVK
ncbi:hypothetical protein GpartN1_g4149.t1 [Galdieria partita]|uniref:GTP-binding protein Era n=1 Tax=Galdieria partita TaxID=83374 RepID=A0A9C7PWU2_9RHOD|nr:hypothetical protein GpartN1_g4149.t1 [Galdieria partita]